MTRKEAAVLAALAVSALSACSSGDHNDNQPATAPGVAFPSPSVQNPAIPQPSTRILTRIVGRTGSWQDAVGKAGDRGDVTIRLLCTGGGKLTVRTSHGGSATNACTGATFLYSETNGAPEGPFTVTVQPDGSQRWSLFIARGPAESGSEWPSGAPEILPVS